MDCDTLLKAIDAFLAKEDDNLEDALDKAGFAEPGDTVAAINSLEDRITDVLTAQSVYFINGLSQAVDLEAYAAMLPGLKASDMTHEKLAEIFLEDFKTNIPKLANAYIKKIDPQLTVDIITKRVTYWAEEWAEPLSYIMELKTHDTLQKLLVTHLKEGTSIAEFTQAIMDSGIREERWRARRVAITESLTAHSFAQQEAITQNPAVDEKEWVHTGSHRVAPRENHIAMNGVKVPKGEHFELLGADGETYQPFFPHDPILPPGERVNCHCIHRGVPRDDILGLSLEERKRLQQEAIDADDGEWEKELDARNRARAGIE